MKKIYEFDFDNGSVVDWVLADDLQDAKETHEKFTGCCEWDRCKISEVPREEWSKMFIIDVNGDYCEEEKEGYSDGYKIKMSFAEYAEKNFSSQFIASTEY